MCILLHVYYYCLLRDIRVVIFDNCVFLMLSRCSLLVNYRIELCNVRMLYKRTPLGCFSVSEDSLAQIFPSVFRE